MLKARVTARLGGKSNLKPIPADGNMTQPVGAREDGTLVTYPPKLKIEASGNALVLRTVNSGVKEGAVNGEVS